MKAVWKSFWLLILIAGLLARQTKGEERMSVHTGRRSATVLPGVRLKIVYNNYAAKEGLTTDWGFGCVIEGAEKAILFDTGSKGRILLDNMKQMGVSADSIGVVALSHIHWDHTGGLKEFLETNSQVTVFVPPSFPASFKRDVTSAGARCLDVKKGTPILPGVWSTGELGRGIKEQALFAATPEGLVVVTGCAHPGVVEMVRGAKEAATELGLGAEEVALVTGGFHMIGMGDAQIQRTINELRALGVKQAAPSHCSGDRTRALFQEAFGADCLVGDLGGIITIGNPASR